MMLIKDEYARGAISKAEYIQKMWSYHNILFEYADFIQNTDVSALKITGGRVIADFKTFPISLFVPRFDRRTPPIEALNFGEYESAYATAMVSAMKGQKVIFDVGANIGYYSVIAGATYPLAAVYSFEPTPETYSELVANIELNQLKNVYPNKLALSDREDKRELFYDREESGAASFCNIRENDAIIPVSVKQVTMDSFAFEKGIFPDFIKCDVEGAEFLVFKGATEVLKHSHPVIFVEILRKWCRKFGHEASDVVDFLKGFEYIPHVLRGHDLIPIDNITEDTEDTNFIFIYAGNQ